MQKQTLLVVDDEVDNLDALERIFRKRYNFLKANSGMDAIEILSRTPHVDVIITDQRMPKLTGVEFLERTLDSHPKTVRILLTGYTDIESIIAAVNKGHIFRYITKPWDTIDLVNSVEQAMHFYARGQEIEEKNKELLSAYNELKILDEAKNKFMVLINHELKTPLTVISSFSDLMSETKLTEEQSTYLDRIQKSALRLHEVVEDTLLLTYFSTGILKLNQSPYNLESLIQEAIANLKNETEKKNTSFRLTYLGKSVGSANIDVKLMQRALSHLIKNSIRFSPPGSIIQIELNPLPESVQFAIENEGGPIPMTFIKKITSPFNLQTEIMNHTKGLGLGLSVANAILKAHRADLTVENISTSSLGQKVRISFSIPL